MGTFDTMLGPYFESCEDCDYGNKAIILPSQRRNVIEISFSFAAHFFCSKKSFYIAYLYLHRVSEISFGSDLLSCFVKSFI